MSDKRRIRLYKNRRLYDCDGHCYVTHDDLRHLLDEEVEFQIEEQWSGHDCTHRILAEILVESEAKDRSRTRTNRMTAEFLRQLICVHAAFEPALVRAFLDHTMRTLMTDAQNANPRKQAEAHANLA